LILPKPMTSSNAPQTFSSRAPSDERMRRAAQALAEILRDPNQSSLETLARRWGISTSQASRDFADCVGISPKRFSQFARAQTGLESLARGSSVLEASFDAGGSSAGFLHAISCSAEALSPGEAASGGAGLALREGFFHTILGLAHCARGPRGVAHLCLLDDEDPATLDASRRQLRARFPRAAFKDDPRGFEDLRAALAPGAAPARIHAMLSGTNFQIKAWTAALGVPCGSFSSYGQLAERAGSPGAARALGSAMAANPIALLIPCHRALRAGGAPGAYRWGAWRKRAILALEAASRPDEQGARLPRL
jgi:AraC family transcriptional regulator of adaptative response/methylated-DNA-[protein]-cysteine methyltransferase